MVKINASPEKVWTALTTPKLIKQWFFGVNTVTDWKVGSPIVHTGEWQGKAYEDKGNILKIFVNLFMHTTGFFYHQLIGLETSLRIDLMEILKIEALP